MTDFRVENGSSVGAAVWGSITGTLSNQNDLESALDAKLGLHAKADTAGNADTVTTNANLTGPVTSSGNATSIASSITLPGSPTTTTQAQADNSTKIATTAYVDTAVLGQNYKEACKYASTAALPSIIYNSGAGTITGVALAAISLDSSSPSVNDRVLIKNQTSTFQNGIYTVTATGSGIAVFVLTRTTDANASIEFKTGDSVFITSGSTLSSTTWAYTGIDSPNFTSDAMPYAQIAGQGSFIGGTGITITGTSIAIDTSVTVDKTTIQTLTNKTLTSPILTTPVLGTPSSGTLTNCTFPTLNQNTSGSAASLSVSGQTGLMTVTGLASTNRIKTVRDAADTFLELGGSYTPTGTWTSMTMVTPALGTPASGIATNLTGTAANLTAGKATVLATARNINGVSFDGSASIGPDYIYLTSTSNVNTTSAAWSGLSNIITITTAANSGITFSGSTFTFTHTGVYEIQTILCGFDTNCYMGLRLRRTNNTAITLAQQTSYAAGTVAPSPGSMMGIFTVGSTTDAIDIQYAISGTASTFIGTTIDSEVTKQFSLIIKQIA